MKPPDRHAPRRQSPRAKLLFRGSALYAFALRALAALGMAALLGLSGCEGGGGGTETESNLVAGRAVNEDGSPAALARVTLRPADYLQDLVSTDEVSPRRKDTVTDAQGRFHLGSLPAGDYRVEIAGAEARGSIHDFSVAADSEGAQLEPDTVKPRGSILGSFAPDSETQLTRFVQVFGMERLVKADYAGNFILYNLPEGRYDIRCSSLQPFRRDAILRGVVVHSGQQTLIDPMRLEKEAKLAFTVDAGGVTIEGLDSANPVILDNERWDNGVENEYIWAKASMGSLDLRGNIVTGDLNAAQSSIPGQLAAGREELRLAGLAGFTGIPDLVAGAAAPLGPAPGGRVEEIKAVPSAGSDRIVAEARKATPEKPLLVVVGGPLTTVAQAYLTDPSIAPRMVVAGVFSYNINAADSAAGYLVAKKCRFVQWGRTYTWAGRQDTARIKDIPQTRMGEKVRAFLSAGVTKITLGDLAPAAFLFHRGLWKTVNMVKVSSALEVQPASDITFDFLDVPPEANDWQAYNDEFYSTLADPAAYHPKAVPGALPPEGYAARTGISPIPFDSAEGAAGIALPQGAWSEYRISAATPGRHAVVFRYRCGAGGRIGIGLAGQPAAETDLPASIPWMEATSDSLSLDAGPAILRISSVLGKIDLIGMEIR